MKSLRLTQTQFPRVLFAAIAALFIQGAALAANDISARDIRTEVMVGQGMAERFLDRYGVFEHEVLSRYVERVGQKLVGHAGRPEIHFHFLILDTDEMGAYAAPGGYVFITRGALIRLHDEAELASMLAHEIGHIAQHHLMQELRPLVDTRWGIGTVHTAVSSARLNKVATAQANRKGIEILLGPGLGQEMELEADGVGARLMELAGYVAPTPHEHIPRLHQNHAASAQSGPTMASSNRGSVRSTVSRGDASPMIYVGGKF